VDPELFNLYEARLRNYDGEVATYSNAILRLSPERRLGLELGAGTGQVAERLLALRSLSAILALDSDPAMAKHLYSRRIANLLPVLARAEHIPLAEYVVDVVYAPFGFITNFEDEARLTGLLHGLQRTLRRSGLLLLNAFDPDTVCELYPNGDSYDYSPIGPSAAPVARLRVQRRDAPGRVTLYFTFERPAARTLVFNLRGWKPIEITAIAFKCGFEYAELLDSDSELYSGPDAGEYVIALVKR
jgi:SAM-dependent methyltransferase